MLLMIALVVDEKGIYSLEKFLIARRLMYWQVYMHKTVLSSESLLVNILKRAKELANDGFELYTTPALRFFLYNNIGQARSYRRRKIYAGNDRHKFYQAR